MKLLQIQNRINELMSLFITQVKGASSMGRTDINHVSETILIPLFREVYGYRNLKNLNATDDFNFPGIDLGDDEAKVAFQITSTSSSQKIKDTLRKFVKYELYKRYNRLIIYILTEKQNAYTGSGYEAIIQDTFVFDKNKDIQDYRNILTQITSFQIEQAQRVQAILEKNFANGANLQLLGTHPPQTETLYLNLLELFFPDKLYVADLDIDRSEIIKNSKSYIIRLKRNSPTRKVVRAALEQLDLRFGVDWVCHENKIITFHNLDDETKPITKVIDTGTVTIFSPDEFYSVDDNYERVFKYLLGECLRQKLYHQGVIWQHEEKLYIFSEMNDEARRVETWLGKRKGERLVFERIMKDNKPDEVLYCKHFAFRTQYKRFGENWYLLIKPDWFFSYNGYSRNDYKSDDIDFLKKKERNYHVHNHLRFITFFLKPKMQMDLFEEKRVYPFLSFGELAKFDNAPRLDDTDWNPPKGADVDAQDDDFLQTDLWSL